MLRTLLTQRMKKQYDYDIFVKRVNLSEPPEELVIRLTCGKNELVIPTSITSNYQCSSSLQCKNCNVGEDIHFTISYYDDSSKITVYFTAEFPFKQLCTQADHYDRWITIYHKDTNRIAGALQLCLVSQISQYEIGKVDMRDYAPEPYSHRPKELRTISAEHASSHSVLGSFGSYYMY